MNTLPDLTGVLLLALKEQRDQAVALGLVFKADGMAFCGAGLGYLAVAENSSNVAGSPFAKEIWPGDRLLVSIWLAS